MRKLIIIVLAVSTLYAGSAIAALISLAGAVERRDASAILARIDQVALRRSIVSQVLSVYLDERQASPRNRFLAQSVGATIADAMIEKLMTAENVVNLLREGKVAPTDHTSEISINLARLSSGDVLGLLGRFRISGIRRFAARLTSETGGDEHAELLMEFQPFSWKVISIKLPKTVLRELASKISAVR